MRLYIEKPKNRVLKTAVYLLFAVPRSVNTVHNPADTFAWASCNKRQVLTEQFLQHADTASLLFHCQFETSVKANLKVTAAKRSFRK